MPPRARAARRHTGRAGRTGRCRRWRALSPGRSASSILTRPGNSRRRRQHGVSAHIAVVLLGDPCLAGRIRGTRAGPATPARRPGPPCCGQARPGHRAASASWARGRCALLVVNRSLRRRRCRAGMSTIGSPRQVISSLPVPVTSPMTVAGHVPPGADLQEARRRPACSTIAIMRSCDSLIRISAAPQRGIAQRDGVEADPHADAAARWQARWWRRNTPAAPRSWMPTTRSAAVELQAALDKQFLHERVADLDARPLRPLAGPAERRTGKNRRAANAIRAGPSTRKGPPCFPVPGDPPA